MLEPSNMNAAPCLRTRLAFRYQMLATGSTLTSRPEALEGSRAANWVGVAETAPVIVIVSELAVYVTLEAWTGGRLGLLESASPYFTALVLPVESLILIVPFAS